MSTELPIILDIRTIDEYKTRHICNSILIPTNKPPLNVNQIKLLEENLAEKVADINTDSQIKVYCKKGIRAKYAVDYLSKIGFTNVQNIGGLEEPVLQTKIQNNEYQICLCGGENKEMFTYCS